MQLIASCLDEKPPFFQSMRLTATLLIIAALVPTSIQQAPSAYPAANDTTGVVRRYYVAAEEVEWDYAPSGYDLFRNVSLADLETATWTVKSESSCLVFGLRVLGAKGGVTRPSLIAVSPPLPPSLYSLYPADHTIGTKYLKALYREYTDATFNTLAERPAWSGYLGPILRAEVGDKIEVNFWNRARYNFSMHPHGVLYTLDNEGALYEGSQTGSVVPPNGRYKYTWSVPERSGPGPADVDSIVWGYHSHVTDHKDLYAGLTGAIIIYKKGLLDTAQNKHKNFEEEFVLSFLVVDENESQYMSLNLERAGLPAEPSDRAAFEESNQKHAINGLLFANLRGLDTLAGDRVRFYLLGWGTEVDLHTAVFHGNTLLYDQHRVDAVGRTSPCQLPHRRHGSRQRRPLVDPLWRRESRRGRYECLLYRRWGGTNPGASEEDAESSRDREEGVMWG
ncbi:Cupredoxin [Jimgerdemannia flammicorona]|uniref:Cupredoxin n=1 Tax=Jimgerdemannia flammicorona TaxID=994334 RepID=A0A433QYY4_9FUNG|nr:Cupredoxin [Jimgerdemannia flammicorona]